jgi:hypothetical protein
MAARRAAVALAALGLLTGCGSSGPDYALKTPPPIVRAGRGVAPVALAGGALKVVTTNLSEGWLRKNGVAYSERTSVVEYWDRTTFPNGDTWLIVTAVVSDPLYLVSDYTTSMHFKREPDGSKWKPSACKQ